MFIKYQDQVPDSIVEATGNPKIAKWFWEEYKKKEYAELAAALKEQEEVSRMNFKASERGNEAFGVNTFTIARRLRNWIARVFGWEALSNPEFIRELIRDNRDLCCFVPTYEKKPVLVKTRDLLPA